MRDNDFTPEQLTDYKIIDRYRSEELRDKPIFDFIPKIVGMRQMWILNKWTDFFREKGVPFIVARKAATCQWDSDQKAYSIWKERCVF